MELPDGFEPWQAWLGAGVLLGVLELFSLDLLFAMLAAGALVGMTVDLIGLPLWIQALAAIVASVAALGLIRPSVARRLHSGPELTQGSASFVGTQAVVVEEVSWQGGMVRLAGELWTARPYDEHEVIATGSRVEIFEIKGATAYVHALPEIT